MCRWQSIAGGTVVTLDGRLLTLAAHELVGAHVQADAGDLRAVLPALETWLDDADR